MMPSWSRRHCTVGSGDRTHVTPPDGGTPTTTISDARGRTVELRQYHGSTPTGTYDATSYGYTPGGQLEAVTDPAGNQWRYTYDLRGRKVEQSDPDSGVTRFVYDVLDRLVSTTDARGVTLHHSYDPLGRKLATREGSATGPLLTSWVYDTVREGQLASATRHVDGQEYTTRITNYDRLYRPIRTYVIIPEREGLLAGNYQYNTRYRLDGLVQTTGFPAAGGMTAEGIVHTYDADDLGRLTELEGDTTYVTNTNYSYTGKLEQLTLSTGGPATQVTNSYEYGTKRLATSRVERVGVAGVDRHATYSYDHAGNIESISDVSRPGTDTQCFTYDYLRRLTEAWTQDTTTCAATPTTDLVGGPAPYWHTYTHDKVGNRQTETLHGLGVTADTVRDYTHPAAGASQPHTLTSVTHTGPDGARTDTYTYDPAGNTTTRTVDGTTQTVDWNPEGRVASVTDDTGATTSFLYDAAGNRLIRRDPNGTTLYLPNMELRVDAGATAATATRYYQHNGQTIAIRTNNGVQFLAADHHGTALLSINATDHTLTRRRYTPYGQPRSLLGTWTGERGFVGGTTDPSTRLTNLGARQYDPDLGRFISIDPLIDHTDPQQMHGYAYANNNPIVFADPDGLAFFECGGSYSCTGNGGLGDTVSKGNKDRGSNDTSRSAPGRAQERSKQIFADRATLGSEAGVDVVTVDRRAMAAYGKHYSQLNPQQQREVMAITWCYNNPNACAKWLDEQGYDLGEFLLDATGASDANACRGGSVGGCGWTVVGLIPVAKLFRGVAKVAKALGRLVRKGDDLDALIASGNRPSKKQSHSCRAQVPATLRLGAIREGAW